MSDFLEWKADRLKNEERPVVKIGHCDADVIVPRKFRVNYQDPEKKVIEKKWVADDSFLTHWMNAYTMTIPEGEKFNVRTVKPYIKSLKSDKLKQQASGFVAQELSHGRAHNSFVKVLEQQGYNTRFFSSIYNFVSFKIMEPLSTPLMRLAFVVAVERINEVIGEVTLESKILDNSEAPAAVLYKWHFAEEIEHKSVVFDVYHDVSGNKFLLGYSTLLCYLINTLFLCFGAFQFAVQDGSILRFKTWKRGFQYFFFKEKFFWRLTKGCFSLLRKGFHPSQSNNMHLADEILIGREIDVQ